MRKSFTSGTDHGDRDDPDIIFEQVNALCNQIRTTYLDETKEYARAKVLSAVATAYKDLCKEDKLRLRYLEKMDTDAGDAPIGDGIINGTVSNRTDADSEFDECLQSLNQIIANAPARPLKNDNESPPMKENPPVMKPILIPPVKKMPQYDAWVPLRTNFRMGEQLELQPYMPFLGDEEEKLKEADRVREEMGRDANKGTDVDIEVSDGSINSEGDFKELDHLEWKFHGDLAARRLREANRRAILGVIDEFGDLNKNIKRALGQALDLEPRKRLDKITTIARKRETKRKISVETKKTIREELQKMKRAIQGEDEPAITPMCKLIAENMEQFCFICQLFHCGQHDNQNFYPVIPIRDPHQEIRLEQLEESKIGACKNECHMNKEERNQIRKTPEWSDAELSILNEYLSMFGKDPCYLAIIVGKSCTDVAVKISGETKDTIALITNADEKLHGTKNQKDLKRGKGEKSDDVITVQKFVPCSHEGDCTVDSNCPCVKRGHPCEIMCGCKNARFCEGLTGRGISRFVDRSSNMAGQHGLCSNLTPACNCTESSCDSEACPCRKKSRACNPDICEGCECNILGSKITPSVRRCRNISPYLSSHKKTIIGRSDVHGYGLFAGDKFSKGELIGSYAGQLPDSRQANITDYLYDVKGRTFFFDMHEGQVIDAGLLGAKTKFVNHAKPEDNNFVNCDCRLVRYRGEDEIALYASRDIETGEEIRFDYKFDGHFLGQEDKSEKSESGPKPNKIKKGSRQKRRTPSKSKN